MRPISILTLIIVFHLSQTALFATTYYVDATRGNDTNAGTSTTAPWKTLNKINNTPFQPGDSILLKRNEIWKEYLNFSSSGKPGNPIVIASYGTGNLPIITGRQEYEGWNIAANWTSAGNNLWYREQSYNPQRLWINGEEVLRHEQIDSLDGTRYMWAWENSKLYIYSTKNPAVHFNSMETNVLFNTVSFNNQHYILIQDIEIQGGYDFALAIRGCSYITVKHCAIGNYARQGIQIRNNRGISSTFITIDNCVLDSKFNFSYGKDKGIDDGIQMVSGANDCVIKDNVIKDFGHTGIYLKAISASDNGVFNNKIYGNFISGEHVTYFRGLGTDGYENKCRDNEFFNNIIKNTTVRSQINGNHNWIHHNIFDGVKNSIVKSWGVGQAIDLQGYGTDQVCHDNKIDNNLIMNCDEPGITFSGNGNNKFHNYVRNNIILNCGRNSKAGYDGIGIAIENSNTIQINYFYNNCIYNGSENAPAVFVRGAFLTVQEFNHLNNALDMASDNIQNDPLLETPDSLYYYLTGNSPCIDAGIPVGLSYDFYGNPIFSGSAPDIGIHEYTNPDDIAPENNAPVKTFALKQNYPNPFNPVTVIEYQVPRSGRVTLTVFNAVGQKIATLVNTVKQPGVYHLTVDGTNLAAGIYFYQLQANGFTATRKMVLIK